MHKSRKLGRFELTVKVQSLGAECTIIRLTELKVKREARRARRRQVDAAVDRLVESFWSLREHRGELRAEVRATLLALAFFRGTPYARMEKVAREDPPLSRAEDIARKFGDGRFADDAWAAWEAAARDHIKTFPGILREREEAKRVRAEARNEMRAKAAEEAALVAAAG